MIKTKGVIWRNLFCIPKSWNENTPGQLKTMKKRQRITLLDETSACNPHMKGAQIVRKPIEAYLKQNAAIFIQLL